MVEQLILRADDMNALNGTTNSQLCYLFVICFHRFRDEEPVVNGMMCFQYQQ
jgi:hypothetical protein